MIFTSTDRLSICDLIRVYFKVQNQISTQFINQFLINLVENSTMAVPQREASGLSQFKNMSDADVLKELLAFLDEYKIMMAGRCLLVLEGRAETNNTGADADELQLPASILPLADGVKVKLENVRRWRARVESVRKECASDDGWELQRDEESCRVMYQMTDNCDCCRIRLEGNVDAPLFDVIALLYEMELWKSWVPSFGGLGLSDVIRLGESSPINMGVHLEVG